MAKELSPEEKEEKKRIANQKRREASIRNNRAKREAKVKELQETLDKLENGEIDAPTIGQSKYLPNQQYKMAMTGNEFYANTIKKIRRIII